MTPKQERFCREFGKDHKPLKAAVRAGYKSRTLHIWLPRLAENEKVVERIRELHCTAHTDVLVRSADNGQVTEIQKRMRYEFDQEAIT